MAKRIITAAILLCLCAVLVAGDAAAFVDLGFSKDGRTYMFAQHGSIDKTWRGFAEIYTVDIAKNDYIDAGCFKISASAQTESVNGAVLYERLFEKNAAYIKTQSPVPADLTHTLYIKEQTKTSAEEIVFTDFEGSTKENPVSFHIKLIPWYGGKTASSKSSFFISVERRDKTGKILSKQVAGTPDIKRTGVTDYTIEKIVRSPDNKSLIFVVEKKTATAAGMSVRYMVEALILK
ncbi:DUF2259 domain-containing protein [Treponema sp. OMZ 840]|uniref:DUF2259 domain-containing protein n=1 Tax=Treponema sp. OMZ 840 TaxID=244313 RepID=UPI003D9491B9